MKLRIIIKKSIWIRMSIISYLIFYLLPAIPTYLPEQYRLAIMAVFIGTGAIGLFMSKDRIKHFALLIAIFVFVYLVYLGKYKIQLVDFSSSFFSLFLFWFPMLLGFEVVTLRIDNNGKMFKLLLALTMVTCITTIIGNITYPASSRFLAGAATESMRELFEKKNIGGFGFIYGLSLFFPYLLYKQRTERKTVYYICSIVLLITVLISQYFIALGICLICYFFYFLNSENRIIRRLNYALTPLAIVILIIILVNPQILVALLDSLGMDEVGRRFYTIASFLNGRGLEGDFGERIVVYQQSIDIFRKSPIIGCLITQRPLGGHSEFLDILAGEGLVGLFLFYVIIRKFHVNILNSTKGTQLYFYSMMSFGCFLLLFVLNPVFLQNIGISLFLVPALLLSSSDIEYT